MMLLTIRNCQAELVVAKHYITEQMRNAEKRTEYCIDLAIVVIYVSPYLYINVELIAS